MSAALVTNLVPGFLGFLVTVMVMSYWISDNKAFRLAVYAFIGVSTGYITVVIIQQVIFARILLPFFIGTTREKLFLIVPIIFSVLLLFKVSERFEWFGRPVTAFIVGVGAAAAIAGAVNGTIIPQIISALNSFDVRNISTISNNSGSILTGVFTAIGTIFTLAAFQFSIIGKNKKTGEPGPVLSFIAKVGGVFIAITLGAVFSGVLLAALSALIYRIQSLVYFISVLFTTHP
ncbi:MAG: hypothetical protein WCP19_00770 [Chloroflexota bacterium]